MGKKIRTRTMAQMRDPNEAGLSVVVRGDSPQEFLKAMRKFKRKVAESGIINDAITIASNIEKPKPSPKSK